MKKHSSLSLKSAILKSKALFWVISLIMLAGFAASIGLFYVNYQIQQAAQPIKIASVANPDQKATYTPTPTSTPTNTPTPTPTPIPTKTNTPRPIPTNTPQPYYDSGIQRPSSVEEEEYWVEINLSEQKLYLHYGSQIDAWFWVSTGKPSTPTYPGLYQIYVMYESTLMVGPDYYLPNVPYVMYYDRGYGIHGTYWDPPLGSTFSHGCTNMNTNDALYIYQRVHVGTTVYIHY